MSSTKHRLVFAKTQRNSQAPDIRLTLRHNVVDTHTAMDMQLKVA